MLPSRVMLSRHTQFQTNNLKSYRRIHVQKIKVKEIDIKYMVSIIPIARYPCSKDVPENSISQYPVRLKRTPITIFIPLISMDRQFNVVYSCSTYI